jgi:hypothetical protein
MDNLNSMNRKFSIFRTNQQTWLTILAKFGRIHEIQYLAREKKRYGAKQ